MTEAQDLALKRRIAGTGRTYFNKSLTLYRPGSDIRCRLCGGLIVRQELYAHVKFGRGDERYVAPVCRGCQPFDVVELID